MDHEMNVEIDAGYWLTASHLCSQCQCDAPVTVLVATQGCDSWANVMASINEPSFVIHLGGDVPLEVVKQRWSVNPNLGMPSDDERLVNDLGNVCQACGTRVDDVDLIEPGGPFLPDDPTAEAKLVLVPLEHLPFTAYEAQVCEGVGLPALLKRMSR